MRLHLLAAAVLSAATATAAHADGLPVGNVDTTRTGVTIPGATERYFAVQTRGDTVLSAVRRAGGTLQRVTTLGGLFTVPAAAQDGTTTGLAANGQTLVLVRPRLTYRQRTTHLVVLDAQTLRLQRRITLRGDFSVDAISPDGRRLYLIQYTSPNDPFAYAVRSLRLADGRLDAGEIVDPRERDEVMHGMPLTRTMSPDSRWAYTLYDGAGGGPFVHALDTTGRTARCIDLPLLPGGVDLNGLRLAVRGDDLLVRSAIGTVATIDRTSFAARRGGPKPQARSAAAPDGGFPWGLAAAVAAVAGAAVVLLRRRYAAGTDSAASRSASSSSPTVP